MPDKLKQLYEVLSQDPKKYKGVGSTYEKFSSAMQDPAINRQVYEAISQDTKKFKGVGSTYESFLTGFGIKKKETPSDGSQGMVDRLSQNQPADKTRVDISEKPVEPLSPQSDTLPPIEGMEPSGEAMPSGFRTVLEKGQETEAPIAGADEMEVPVKSKMPPDSAFEYIMEAGGMNSIVTKGMYFLMALDEGMDLNVENTFAYAQDKYADFVGESRERTEAYDASFTENVASSVLGLFLDAVPFTVMGSAAQSGVNATVKGGEYVASKLVKSGATKAVANRSAKRAVISRLTQGGAVSGTTLAQYAATADLMEQLTDPEVESMSDINYGHALKRGGQDFVMGFAAGMFGAGAQMLKQTPAMDKIIKGTVKDVLANRSIDVTGLVAEGGVFTLGGIMHGEKLTWEDFAANVATFGALKVTHKAGVFNKSESFTRAKVNKKEFKTDFTTEELAVINKGREVGKTAEEITRRLADDVGMLEVVMSDPNVPWVTKAKILHSSYGVTQDMAPHATDVTVNRLRDGRVAVETKDANGAVVERSYFSNQTLAYRAASEVKKGMNELAAVDKLQNLSIEEYLNVNAALREAGYNNGVESKEIVNALAKQPSQRNEAENKTVNAFMETVKKNVKDKPTETVEPSKPQSEGKAPKTTEKTPERGVEPLSTKSGTTPPLEGKSPLKSSTDRKSAARADENLKLLETSELPSRKSITEKIKDYVDNRLEKAFKKGGEKEMRLSEAESFTFSNAENLLGTDKARVRSVEDIKKLKSELSESLKNIEAEMAGRTEQAPLKEGQVRYGDKVYESAGALRSDLMKVENIDRLPLSNDPTVMRVLNEVKQEKGILPKEAQDRAVRKQAEKPTYTQQEIDRVPQMREQAKELKQQAEPLDIMDPKKKELLAEAKDINKQADRIERFVEREQTKTQQDAVQKPSTEKMDVGKVPQDGKKVGERDAKKPEAAKKEVKGRSLAEEAVESFSLSESPKDFNKKAEQVKKKFEEYKGNRDAQRETIDEFIKANNAKLREAGMSPAGVKKLVNAKTWTQVGKAIQKVTESLEKQTPKMRAAAMEDFIRGNRGAFEGIRTRTYESMLKKVNEASMSDAKLNEARQYIEEVLGKKEVREELRERDNMIDDILKVTSAKAVLEKGGRGGEKMSVKKGLKTETGEVSDRLLEIGEFVKNGRSKKTPEPMKEMERIDREIESLQGGEISEANIRRVEQLKERQTELMFSEVGKMNAEQLAEMRDYARDLNKTGRAQAKAELEARIEEYKRLTTIANEEITGGEKVMYKPRLPKQSKSTDFWSDTSFPSLISKLAKRGKETGGDRPFSDRLNRELTEKVVIPAETQLATLQSKHLNELSDAMITSFGGEAKAKKRIIDARKEQVETGVFYKDALGRKKELILTEMQALEKLLQFRDPELLNDLTRPVERGGNGYTTETFLQLEKFVGKDLQAFGNWMYESQKSWGKDVYNPVYKKMEGISLSDFSKGYWPSTKDRLSPYAEKGFEPSGNTTILQNRTKKRTGVKAPLKDTDALATYLQYVNEASRYNAWAEGHKKLSYVLRNPQVVQNIKQVYGTRAYDNVNFFLDKFAGKSNRESLDILDYFTNASGAGILALKSMVGLKQTLSSMYYAQDMPASKLARGTARAVKGGTIENEVSKWVEQDPFVQARRDAFLQRDAASGDFWGYTHGGNAKMNKVKDAFSKVRVGVSAAAKPLKKVQSTFIREGDKMPITKAGAAYLTHKYEQYSGKRLTKKVLEDHISGQKENANLKRAKEDWLMMSSMTQQSVRESNISKVRSSGSLARAATQFTSGQAQIWRVTQDNVRKFNKAKKAGDAAGMQNAFKNIMLTHMVSGLVFGLANTKFQVKGNEKELLTSIAMGNLAGVAFIGRMAQFAQALINDKPWADDTLGNMPAVDLLTTAGTTAQRLIKEQSEDSPDQEKMRKLKVELLNNILTLNGIGVEGAENIIQGYIDLYKGESDYPVHNILGFGEPYSPDKGKKPKDE